MSEPSTLDLTRYYLEHMSEIDLNDLEDMAQHFMNIPEGFFSRPDPRIDDLIHELPRLTEDDLEAVGQLESSCPICFVSYRACIAEEEMASAMEHSAAVVPEELGVTKLTKSCGHAYCRKDIIKWMRTASKSCPTCRRPFLPPLEDDRGTNTTRSSNTTTQESSGFTMLSDPSQLEDFMRRASSNSNPANPGNTRNVEQEYNPEVLADFRRFMFGSGASSGAVPTENDRSEYYGMYS